MTSRRASPVLEAAVFPLSGQEEARRALASVESHFQVLREPTPTGELVYLDTFDWRLHQAGMSLASRAANGSSTLRLESARGQLECRLPNGALPAFAADLPAGPLQARIAPLIEERRLLPLARVKTAGQSLRILDERQKTVARVLVERTAVGTAQDEGAPAEPTQTLRVVPVRGYAAALRRVKTHIQDALGLAPDSWRPHAQTMASLPRRPGDYSAKPKVVLDPELRADRAVAVICAQLLDTIVANEDGVRRDLDVEFLHDFRVAIRCTRSALAQLKKVFPADAQARFSAEFKWLADSTGALRDMDVYLQTMDAYRASLPPATARDLAPLEQYLRRQRGSARRRLLGVLRSRRYRKLLKDWRAFLGGDTGEASAPQLAARPVKAVASQRIWRAYRRVLRDGTRIHETSPAEALHRLRIDCKKLRYLLTFFESLYERKHIKPLLKRLKRLQDNLGDFNDRVVQQRILQRYAREMQAEGLASADCLLAMGRLLEHLLEEQTRERRRFAKCFGQFSTGQNAKRFRRLFHESESRHGSVPA